MSEQQAKKCRICSQELNTYYCTECGWFEAPIIGDNMNKSEFNRENRSKEIYNGYKAHKASSQNVQANDVKTALDNSKQLEELQDALKNAQNEIERLKSELKQAKKATHKVPNADVQDDTWTRYIQGSPDWHDCYNEDFEKYDPAHMGEEDFFTIIEKAEEGDDEALNLLGICYEYGYCKLRQNYGEALRWYFKAADHRNTWAFCNIGACYANGRGVVKNYDVAADYFREAADKMNSSVAKKALVATSQLQLQSGQAKAKKGNRGLKSIIGSIFSDLDEEDNQAD